MPLATPELYAEMLDAAARDSFAYPAVNVTSSQTLNAALRGFVEARSDGIVQISIGGAAYLAGGGAPVAGGHALAALAPEIAASAPVRLALHTDHCPPGHVDDFLRPLLAASAERRRAGHPPLFVSQMFDGSTLPLEDNLRLSRELLDVAAAADVVLEVEVGVVGGEEDGIRGGDSPDALYTTPGDLLRVVDELGTGEHGRYLLAATFGNVHGLYAPGYVHLRPEILREGQEALEQRRPGTRFAYVFHGSSGSTVQELQTAVGYGVVKVNLDTEAQYAFSRAVADHVLREYDGVLMVDGGYGRKSAYDPRRWGAKAETAMAARVARACRELGSAGRALGAA